MTAPVTLPCCISGTLHCAYPSTLTFTCTECKLNFCWCDRLTESVAATYDPCAACAKFAHAERTIFGIFFSQYLMARPKHKPKTARDLRFELIAAKQRIAELEEQNSALTESLRQSRADAKALATLTR